MSDEIEPKGFTYRDQISEIIETLQLSSDKSKNATDKSILKNRFLSEVINYQSRRDNTKKYYNSFRFMVTTGSILLPAILSIGQMDPAKLPANFDNVSYWAAWSISLMVTISNGFLQLFSLDKNYFDYAITTEQLKTEGWQFFQLSGKYEDFESHEEAYKTFSKSIETIKRKQVEKEFSGKGDVNKNKGKKKPEFDFQKELLSALPGEAKTKAMEDKLNILLQKMEQGEQSNKKVENVVGNVKDILKDPEVLKKELKEELTEIK